MVTQGISYPYMWDQMVDPDQLLGLLYQKKSNLRYKMWVHILRKRRQGTRDWTISRITYAIQSPKWTSEHQLIQMHWTMCFGLNNILLSYTKLVINLIISNIQKYIISTTNRKSVFSFFECSMRIENKNVANFSYFTVIESSFKFCLYVISHLNSPT